MDTQQTPQKGEDPLPPRWNTRWYRFRLRFLRYLSRFLGMPTPLEVNEALKRERWEAIEYGRSRYLGHCPEHPEELMLSTGRGFRKCCQCWDEDYFKTLDAGPITDPRVRPVNAYNQARQAGAGPRTAAMAATPRRTVKLQPPGTEK